MPPTPAKKETFVGSPTQSEIKVAEEEYDPNGNVVFNRTFDRNASGVSQVASLSSFEYDKLNRQTVHRIHNLDADGNRTRKNVDVSGTVTAIRYVVDDRTPAGYAQAMEEWPSVI